MRELTRIGRLIWADNRQGFLRGLLLSLAVLLAGLALLGLSGWFIAATAVAGLTGAAAAFNVFTPSAGVRFLALGRTVTRYGERLWTHDVTLRALENLRIRLLAGVARKPFAALMAMRASAAINRILADIDALDGLTLRLMFPVVAGLGALIAAALAIAVLASPVMALWVLVATLVPSLVASVLLVRASVAPAAELTALARESRSRVVEHLRGRVLLAFVGGVVRHRAPILARLARLETVSHALARVESRAALALSVAMTLAATGVLALAVRWDQHEPVSVPLVAMVFFATLALGEVVLPVQRGLAEIGRMRDAAGRIAPELPRDGAPAGRDAVQEAEPVPVRPIRADTGPVLAVRDLVLKAPSGATLLSGFALRLEAGETCAITGASGRGKSLLLDTLAGLRDPDGGTLEVLGRDLSRFDERDIRKAIGYLTQRPALIAGTVRDALRMASPSATDDRLNAVLGAVCLDDVLAHREGLDSVLAEAGGNLSGGEARRLALARVLLRDPGLLLLDEPTEGLEAVVADAVLAGCRQWVPDAAIVIAAHRDLERRFAERCVAL